MTKVGNFLWCKDYYRSDSKWERHKITGETKLSWLVDNRKVNKKTMLESMGKYTPNRWYTEQGKNDSEWIKENRIHIKKRVCAINEC